MGTGQNLGRLGLHSNVHTPWISIYHGCPNIGTGKWFNKIRPFPTHPTQQNLYDHQWSSSQVGIKPPVSSLNPHDVPIWNVAAPSAYKAVVPSS